MRNGIHESATQFIAAQIKNQGMHRSPTLVSEAVDLAELLVAEIDQREAAADEAAKVKKAPPPPVSVTATKPPVIVSAPPAS